MSIECELTWLPTLDPRPIAAQNMEPLHGLSPNPAPSSLSTSHATSPTRYFVVLSRNLDFPFYDPENRCFPKGGARLGRAHGPEEISTHATPWFMAIPGRWVFIS